MAAVRRALTWLRQRYDELAHFVRNENEKLAEYLGPFAIVVTVSMTAFVLVFGAFVIVGCVIVLWPIQVLFDSATTLVERLRKPREGGDV